MPVNGIVGRTICINHVKNVGYRSLMIMLEWNIYIQNKFKCQIINHMTKSKLILCLKHKMFYHNFNHTYVDAPYVIC